jgi:hypothetical protein
LVNVDKTFNHREYFLSPRVSIGLRRSHASSSQTNPTVQPVFNPGKYSEFVAGNKSSLDGVNEYRLEAYATLLFGASSDNSRSCGKAITADPPRRKDSSNP